MAKKSSPFSLGDLRGYLSQPPSTALWSLIWEHLTKANVNELEQHILPYAREHFSMWPGGLRLAPIKTRALFLGKEPGNSPRQQALKALLPLIDALEFAPQQSFNTDELERLSENPLCQNLHRLKLILHNTPNRALRAFAETSQFIRLKHLTLQYGNLSAAMISAFSDSPWFGQLHHLGWENISITPSISPQLSRWNMPQLKTLELIRGDKAKFIALMEQAHEPPPLERLALKSTLPEKEHLIPFLKTLGGKSLKTLEFHDCSSYDCRVGELLSEIDHFPLLEELQVTWSYRPTDAEEILTHVALPSLRSFKIPRNDLTEKFVDLLASRTDLEHIEQLDLQYNPIGDQGIQKLCQLAHLASIRSLNLGGTQCKEDGLRQLLNSPNLPHLQSLNLRSNRLGNKKGAALAEAHARHKLKEVDLSYNELGDDLILSILSNPATPELTEPIIFPNPLSISAFFALCSSSQLRAELRESVLEALFDNINRTSLQKIFKVQQLPFLKRHTKTELIAFLIEESKHEELLRNLLISKEFIEQQTDGIKKSTLRAIGYKGHSRLKGSQIEQELLRCLDENPEALFAVRQKFERKLSGQAS